MNIAAEAIRPNIGPPPARTIASGHQALCFGYFHLGQQMKVTRPPGRDPARVESTVFGVTAAM
jgi:hypothetical protein